MKLLVQNFGFPLKPIMFSLQEYNLYTKKKPLSTHFVGMQVILQPQSLQITDSASWKACQTQPFLERDI
jgi:hypothetical protein